MKPLAPLTLPLTGTHLIEASAGTGKTYTITTLWLRLLLELKLDVRQIVVVTFTKAATAELRARVRRRLRDALRAANQEESAVDPELAELLQRSGREQARRLLTDAIQSLDEASIFTIHGFCQRVLTEFAFETKLRFDVDLLLDQRPLILEIVQDFWAREVSTLGEAEVSFLQSAEVDLKDLTSLCATAIQWPELPIVGSQERFDPEPALTRYLVARQQAATLWKRSRAEIRELLTRSTSLNRRSYKPETLARWFEALDTLFATESPGLTNYSEAVERLSRSALEAATNSGKEAPKHHFFEASEWLYRAQVALKTAFENWLIHFKTRLAGWARERAAAAKLERGQLSFDDLLARMASALDGPRGELLARSIREKYPAALIDEFQDTDPLQYAVFSRIYGKPGSTLFLIGDPKQAIYGFRGADIFSYLAAAADAGSQSWTLDTNYRSDKSLVRALNTLFERPHRPFLLDGISYINVKARPDASDALGPTEPQASLAPLEILFVERKRTGPETQRYISKRWADQHLPDWIAADIARLLASPTTLNGCRIKPSDIAVLTRTNAQAEQVGRALGRLAIPSALIGDTSVFESAEADEMRLILRAIAEPTSGGALRSALSTPSLGVSLHELSELSSDESAWERWVESFRRLNEVWERRGLVHATKLLFKERRVSARTLALLDGERRLTNLRHLIELLHQAETEGELGIAGLLSWFDDMRGNPAAREGIAPEAQQIRLESDEYAVQLTTMHKSKGLEYPIVYCPYLWRDAALFQSEVKHLKVHDPGDHQRQKLDLRTESEKHRELGLAKREALAESLRLLYVAMTRARHRTCLVFGAFNQVGDSPLAYLLYQAAEELGALSETPASRVGNMSDAELLSTLDHLATAARGVVAVRQLEPMPAPIFRGERAAVALSEVRRLTRSLANEARIGSFSELTKASHHLSLVESVGRDVDNTNDAALENPTPLGPSQAAATIPLNDFPRGARAGELLHSILEHSDFGDPDSVTRAALSELARHGVPLDLWRDRLPAALDEVLRTELPGARALTLSAIGVDRRVNELEFTLPVRRAHDSAARRALGSVTPQSLAEVFRSFASDVPDEYPNRLAALDFLPLAGFLRGFIDLVFEHEGRYFVVDYKSNHLGATFADYTGDQLVACMMHHHYYLQYHLYVAALDRYLAARLGNYDYDSHFGGVYYLFLRGMAPENPVGTAIFHARPERKMTEGLLKLLIGGEGR